MKRHLKRLAAPATWDIKRKKTMFIARPKPSGHSMKMSVPLNVFMKEMAGLAKTTKEVRTILNTKNVLVDGRRRKDHRFGVGFLDVISVDDTKEAYRIVLTNSGKIGYMPIPAKEANTKICRVIKKKAVKGKKIQLVGNDGKTFIVDMKDKTKVGDSIVIDLKANKITEVLPLEKNMSVFLTSGKHKGALGIISSIEDGKILIKTKDGKEYLTKKQYGFVVGKAKPVIEMQG